MQDRGQIELSRSHGTGFPGLLLVTIRRDRDVTPILYWYTSVRLKSDDFKKNSGFFRFSGVIGQPAGICTD
ncbi:hypothetical protein DC28_12265 [Spirochaeta lutea]|uniref:Uncharacterized protein n=1 Tax=Spirochaeta lutea TaxID=1480694 RepID=A0A098QU06_9SPIO|nr:hypothetical protein DC28_12265 [Spirochaeta lutea]